MSVGHPYFNRDVGNQLNNDPFAYQNQAQMNAQNALFNLGANCGQNMQGALNAQSAYYPPAQTQTLPKKEKSMFKSIASDVKSFILEHRAVIYFIAAALLLDHFFFRGAFKARLQGMADRLVTKVEEKIQ
jgi:hypothetical protein